MKGMTVNFNNLRKQAMFAYEDLTEKLNRSIIKSDEEYATPNGCNYTNLKGHILIDAEEIQNEMDSLRRMIGSIAMVYREGEEDFKDVYEEVPESGGLIHFNEQE